MYSFFQLIQAVALWLIHMIQPILVPLCFVLAWTLVPLALWQVFSALRDGVGRARVMHQIPCASCTYFTNSPFLKCPLHPSEALSEAAISCPDYDFKDPLASL